MAVRVIVSRMSGISTRYFVNRSTSNTASAVPAMYHRRVPNAPRINISNARRCLSTSATVDNTTSVTDLLRQCAEEQRGFENILPLKTLLFSLRSQNSLTWTTHDLVNLAVGLCHTTSSYDKVTVWKALAPLVSAVAEELDTEQLSQLLWSLQGLPKELTDQNVVNTLLVSINSAMKNTTSEDWREEQLAQAAYCVPALNRKSPAVKILFRNLKALLRDVKVGDGIEATFVAMHLQQSTNIAGREVVDVYAALLEKCTTIRGTVPHRVPRDLLRTTPSVPVSKNEVRKQWDQLNPVDAGLSMIALYGSQQTDVLRGSHNEMCYVLYESLGWKRNQGALPLPTEPTLSGESKDVHSVLRRLYENIGQTNTAPSTARALGTSLYGLQQLSKDVQHVRQLLSVSAQQLTDSTTDLYVQELQRTLQQHPVNSGSCTTAPNELRKTTSATRKPSST